MISISGDSQNYWIDYGYENMENFLAVNSCGYQKLLTKDLSRKRDKGRIDYQLIYIVNGKGFFHFDSSITELTKGNIILFSPNELQHYHYYAKDSTEVYWIHFTGYAVDNYLKEFGLLGSNYYFIDIMDEVISLFSKIIYELNMKKEMHNPITAAYLLEILSLFGRKLKDKEEIHRTSLSSDIKWGIEIMYEKYNQNLTVASLAKECNLSLYRFIHKFKTVTGVTPTEYLTGIRIKEAKKLLSDSSFSIAEVAVIVGYENPLYFSRVFHKTVGISPSQFKKQFHEVY